MSHPKLATATAIGLLSISAAAWGYVPTAIAADDNRTLLLALGIAGLAMGAGIVAIAEAVRAWILKGVE